MRLNWKTYLLAVFVVAVGLGSVSKAQAQGCQLHLGSDIYAIGGNQTAGAACQPGGLFFFDVSSSTWVPMVDLHGNTIMARDIKGSVTRFGNLLAVIEHTSGSLILRYGVANAQFYDNSNVARGFVAYLNNQYVHPKSLDSVSANGNQISVQITMGDNRRCTAVADATGVIGGLWDCTGAPAAVGNNPAAAKKPAGLAHIPALSDPTSHESFIRFFMQFRDAVQRRDTGYINATLGWNFVWERDFNDSVRPADLPDTIFAKILRDQGWETLDEVMKSPSGSAHNERPLEVCTPSVLTEDSWQYAHFCFQQQGGEWKVTSFVGAGD